MLKIIYFSIILSIISGCVSTYNYKKKETLPNDKPIIKTDSQLANEAEIALKKLENNRELFDNDDLKALSNNKLLKDLDLSSTQVNDNGIYLLSKFKNVEYLNLHGTQISDKAFNFIKNMVNLKILKLSQTKISGWNIGLLANLNYLKKIDLSSNSLNVKIWEEMVHLSHIEVLTVRYGKVSPSAFKYISKLPLKYLDLSFSEIENPDFSHLDSQKVLGLNLSYTSISLEEIKAIAKFENLRELYLAYCSLNNEKVLALKSLRNLKKLDLSGNEITSNGLSFLQYLHNLESLALSGDRFLLSKKDNLSTKKLFSKKIFQGENLKYIGTLTKLRKLEIIKSDLRNKDLRFLGKLQHLVSIDFSETYVTESFLSKFKSTLPLISIHCYNSGSISNFVAVRDIPLF